MLERYKEQIKKIRGVIGVGLGNGSIVVFVEEITPEVRAFIPKELDGVPVKIVRTGRFIALQDPTERWRPVPGGVSIGHPEVTAGTLGCWVRRKGEIFGLSNNHVIALNYLDISVGEKGDPVLQPGPYDGGTLEDKIGELEEWIDIKEENNLVDAAIFKPEKGVVDDRILEIGKPLDIVAPEVGMTVKKFGRTSLLTVGRIAAINAELDVYYSTGKARFVDQIVVKGEARRGDSGSAVLDEWERVVGLLFAGAEGYYAANRMDVVSEKFGGLEVLPLSPMWYLGVIPAVSPLMVLGGVYATRK